MNDLRRAILLPALALAILPVSCGTGAKMTSTPAGQLQSITISPSTADAQSQSVQFTATGHWSGPPPYTVTPQSAMWGVCVQNQPTAAVTVSSSGMTQCASGAKGTYTVFAYDMTECNAITACGGGCTITGTAQLTCP